MVTISKGIDISTYRSELELNMIHGLKYKAHQVRDMSSQDMLDELLKHNKAKIVNKKDKVLDPFNKQKKLNKSINKVADPAMNAKIRDKEVRAINRDPSHGKSGPDPLKESTHTVTEKVRGNKQKHTTIGKDSVKVKSVSSPRKMSTMGIINKFNKASGWAKLTVGFGVAMGMMWFANSLNRTRTRFSPTYQRRSIDARSSAYIPEKYTRGYDTIKESFTDFGSSVKLNKVAGKVNVTPSNTTRNGFRTSSNSVTRSNLSFQLYDNAINHTRY
jgi:hypothetical protein